MKINLANLKGKAESATPGPWDYDTTIAGIWRLEDGEYLTEPVCDVRMACMDIVPKSAIKPNARFIAAANPATVLKLIEALELAMHALNKISTYAECPSRKSADLAQTIHIILEGMIE